MTGTFEPGVVVVSIDTEQIWGYLDCLSEAEFEARFPYAPEAHPKLLQRLCAAGVRATWFVVGGLAMRNDGRTAERRLSGPIAERVRIPAGDEASAPLWFCWSFLEQLRWACPAQEIGLHGGLTHLVWTDAHCTREIVRRELSEGVAALAQLDVRPRSFSYPRNLEAHHDLLPEHGLQCFRGATPALAWRLGRTIPGAMLRAWEELRRASPPLVAPFEAMPGLWTLPSSMFLYPIGPARTRLLGIRSRVERFTRGLEAAARHRSIFHFSFHPENLVESPHGFDLLDEMLEKLVTARRKGDIEVMTMSEVVTCVERQSLYAM
jgi:hypothetical protein